MASMWACRVLLACTILTSFHLVLSAGQPYASRYSANVVKRNGATKSIRKDIYQPKDQDEDVDMQTEWEEDGSVQLKFTSHGKQHQLHLTENRINLSKIPVKLLGSNEKQQRQVTDELKNVILMKDNTTGAVVAFQRQDGTSKPLLKEGVFRVGKHEFAMKNDLVSGKVKVGRKSAKDILERYPKDKVLLKKNGRNKRATTVNYQPVTAVVELVWILDYSIYADISQLSATDLSSLNYTSHAVNILTYFAHITSIMDDYYRTMQNDDVSISVSLAGMVLITSSTELSSLVEDHSLSGSWVNTDGVLERLSDWLSTTEGLNTMPPYDHVMLATMYDMLDDDGSNGVSGLAYLGTICDPQNSISFVEVREIMGTTVNTAVHELGHSLGADHDGTGSSSACEDDKYIMDSAGGDLDIIEYRSLFSCCSQRVFYATINEVGSCLKTTSASMNYEASIDANVNLYLPGQVFSADDQCYIIDNTKACGDWVYTQVGLSICRRLYCEDPADPDVCNTDLTPAVDGTECGAGMWCLKGECVATSLTRPDVDLNCNVNRCGNAEYQCANGTNKEYTEMLSCYATVHRCDGIDDCTDGSDESCGAVRKYCPADYRACSNGICLHNLPSGVNRYCVHDSWICDGENDCSDESDEAGCDGDCYICTDTAACVASERGCEEKCPNDAECIYSLPGKAPTVSASCLVLIFVTIFRLL